MFISYSGCIVYNDIIMLTWHDYSVIISFVQVARPSRFSSVVLSMRWNGVLFPVRSRIMPLFHWIRHISLDSRENNTLIEDAFMTFVYGNLLIGVYS